MQSPPPARLRVLVLEDSDLVRLALHKLLVERGLEVFSYPEPASCPLHQAGSCQCSATEVCADVLVTDFDMPHMSGLDFVEELRHKGCKIKRIAILSGSIEGAARTRAEELGCKVFMKPEGILDLFEWLDQAEAELQPERHLKLCLL